MFVFTDASYSDSPKMSGCGVIIIDKNGDIYSYGNYTNECKNNNIAEVWAVHQALSYITKYKIMERSGDKTINIMTDSKHVLKHLDDERTNEFEARLFDEIRDLRYEHRINFFHIKGHNHDGTKIAYYNGISDSIAKEYRLLGLERYNKYLRKLVKEKTIEKIKKL